MALLSHGAQHSFDDAVATTRRRLVAVGDTAAGLLSEKLRMLDQLGQFGLGRQLLLHGGLDSQWSHYVHDECAAWRLDDGHKHPLEAVLLELWRGGRERLGMCRRLLNAELFEGITMLSVPCGLMSELLGLDFTGLTRFELVGIDLDPAALVTASERADKLGLAKHTRFARCDAWELPFKSSFDRIVSLGLNTYAPDVETAVALYRTLYRALVPGGKLVLGYMTPSTAPERDPHAFTLEEQRLAHVLFREILAIRFAHTNTTAEITSLLERVGFRDVRCHFSGPRSSNLAVATK
jgi:SAM-dependent methyltransferase